MRNAAARSQNESEVAWMTLLQWGWIRSERNGLSHVVLVLKLEMRRWMDGREGAN